MDHEIECKVKVDSHADVIARLGEIGAEFVGSFLLRDAYFDFAGDELKTADRGLRIRRQIGDEGEKVIVTYKGPREDNPFKSRQEIETTVGEFDFMSQILLALGMKKNIVIEKKRDIWLYGDCEVCLDELPLLGTFVEVEGENADKISKVLEALSLSGLEHIDDGYARLIKNKLKELGIKDKEVIFTDGN
ncbi:MAG: class IV adenylate cyclase [Phycisphaerae bacterium]|nr:class IV adenylate cyclase [Phycisphaerae bacterium]